MVMEVRYGKVREWSEAHDRVQWIGFAQNNITDERCVVSSKSTKQRAKDMRKAVEKRTMDRLLAREQPRKFSGAVRADCHDLCVWAMPPDIVNHLRARGHSGFPLGLISDSNFQNGGLNERATVCGIGRLVAAA